MHSVKAWTLMGSLRLAIARDEAFCFYYQENIRELERAGFEIVYFSPLRDDMLPDESSGLYIGGGYPELHARVLSENTDIAVDINHNISSGMPVFAECGGFMYLTERVSDPSGDEMYAMCGILAGECRKTERLVRFGYVEIYDETGSWLEAGDSIRGHEFHYYDCSGNGDASGNGEGAFVKKASTGDGYRGIHITDTIWAGWPHLYLGSSKGFAKSFYRKCGKFKEQN